MHSASQTAKYKGKAPFGIDHKLAWFIKIITQVIIFTLIYAFNIGQIQQKYQNILIELGFVFLWFIVADGIAFVISLLCLIAFNNKMQYLYSKRKKGNVNRRAIEYVFYTSFRCLIYFFGVITAASQSLSIYIPLFLAYLLVWMGVFFITNLAAKGLSIGITHSV